MSAPADRVRSIQYGCFALLSMTGQRWHSEQFVIPSVSEESSAWMLHCACAALSMTRRCHSERSEESSAWMLRFAQHDKLRMANLTLLSLSFNKERDVCASRQGEVNPAWVIMPILAIVWVDAQWFGLDCVTGDWDFSNFHARGRSASAAGLRVHRCYGGATCAGSAGTLCQEACRLGMDILCRTALNSQ